MDKHGDSPNAGRTEQAQILESAVRPTQSPQTEGGVQPTGRHQITHAQEATLLELFGIRVKRAGAGHDLEREQVTHTGHGTTMA